MDRTDRKIIKELQQNGRISLTELSEKVGLSLTPCQRRVRLLEQKGIIRDYQANVDAKAVGLNFSALVFVKMPNNSGENIADFEQALTEIPEVIQAQMLLGDPDSILHIVCRDIEHFQQLYETKLTKLPHITGISSTLIMKDVIKRRALPL